MLWKIILLAASLATAVEVTLVLPATNSRESATLSIIGAGKDGRTTYVAFPPAKATNTQPFTFAEGASDLIVPETRITSSTLGVVITASASLSCGLRGDRAGCAIAANVNGKKTTLTVALPVSSYVFQAVGQTSLIGKPVPTGGALNIKPAIAAFGFVALVGSIYALC